MTRSGRFKQIQMTKIQNSKRYDLEDRTLRFAQGVIAFAKSVPWTLVDAEIVRIKICRKEAKESGYWLKLVATNDGAATEEKAALVQEATELTKIFGAILERSK